MLPSPGQLSDAAANLFDMIARGGLADLRETPARIVHEEPKCTVFRYLGPDDDSASETKLPVLLVTPLAAPHRCFDLRRGHSFVEHLLGTGHRTYLLDYGAISFSDRELGLEHWVEHIVPTAIRKASEDAGGQPVQLVGWSLGGILALLPLASDPSLPVNAVAMVGTPFDFTRVPLMAPFRPLSKMTNGAIITSIYRTLGGAPSQLVTRAFKLTSIDKTITKPFVIATNLHDRDFLAQVEAVDAYMERMYAYPGRTLGQLYHQFFRVNDLADGHLVLSDREIDLGDVTAPVLSVAGLNDVLAPQPAVHHVGELLPGSAEVRLESAPGGHLGVLAGRGAKETTWRYVDEFFDAHAAAPRPPRTLRVVA